jgi:hypothetical protein
MAEKDHIRLLEERDRELDRLLTEFEKLSPAERAADAKRGNEYLKGLPAEELKSFLNGAGK